MRNLNTTLSVFQTLKKVHVLVHCTSLLNKFIVWNGTYVFMFNSCPLWLCPWKRTASTQLGQGERSFKEVLFTQPHEQTWLATRHWIDHMEPIMLLDTDVGKRKLKGIPRLFQALSQFVHWIIWAGNPHFTWAGEIAKSFPRRTHCKLWVFFFGSELEGTAMQTQDILNLSSTTLLTSPNLYPSSTT